MTDMFIARVLNPNRRYARMSVVRIGVLEATASNEAAITVNLGDRFALLHLKEARVLRERIATAIIAVTGGGEEPDHIARNRPRRICRATGGKREPGATAIVKSSEFLG